MISKHIYKYIIYIIEFYYTGIMFYILEGGASVSLSPLAFCSGQLL